MSKWEEQSDYQADWRRQEELEREYEQAERRAYYPNLSPGYEPREPDEFPIRGGSSDHAKPKQGSRRRG